MGAAGEGGSTEERIEGVRIPCWDAKRRVWQAIELLERERRTEDGLAAAKTDDGSQGAQARGGYRPLKLAAIYARVSTDRQEKEQTVESQLDLLHRAAEEDGYEVAPSHVFIDERRSGSHLDRPGLDRLRDLASEGTFEAVLIASPDRLARNYAYQVIVFEERQRAGCEVVFLNHSFGETPEERMLLQMQGVFAEYERALIKEQTRRGRLFAARQGRVNWSHAPYGYRLILKTESAPQKLVIDETEAEVVRQIFRWCVEERMSCYAMEKRLRHMGAPTREGSPLGWWQSTVGDILRNTSYKARRRRSCHEGQAQSFYWQYFATKYRRKFRIRLETALSLLRSGETESACVAHGSIAVPCSFSNDVFGTFRFIFSQILAPYDSLTVTGPTNYIDDLVDDRRCGMDERQRPELEKVEFEYMEAYDRGDYPTLEELILRYPGPENGELRVGIAEFVLDYIELTNAARRVEFTKAELADAQVIQEWAIRRCLEAG